MDHYIPKGCTFRDHGSGHPRLRDGIASRRKGREIDEWTTISQKVVLSVTTDRVTADCVRNPVLGRQARIAHPRVARNHLDAHAHA
jgi:hypothetical protein